MAPKNISLHCGERRRLRPSFRLFDALSCCIKVRHPILSPFQLECACEGAILPLSVWGRPLPRATEDGDEGEVCRITSLPGFDDPTGGCPRTQHVGGRRQAVRRWEAPTALLFVAIGLTYVRRSKKCYDTGWSRLFRGAVSHAGPPRRWMQGLEELRLEKPQGPLGASRCG